MPPTPILSFFDVGDVRTRIALRRCFAAFAIAFRDNDWVLSGKGIPQSVVLRVFKTIISSDKHSKHISPSAILSMLEKLNLIERARHGLSSRSTARYSKAEHTLRKQETRSNDENDSDWEEDEERTVHRVQQFFVMHDSVSSDEGLANWKWNLSGFLTIVCPVACETLVEGCCRGNGEAKYAVTVSRSR